jgi:hypothetical protein
MMGEMFVLCAEAQQNKDHLVFASRLTTEETTETVQQSLLLDEMISH